MKTLIIYLFTFLSLLLRVFGLEGCSRSFGGDTTRYVTVEGVGDKLIHSNDFHLSNHQDRICIYSKESKTNITVKLVDQYYTYKDFEHQYYIPRTLNIECPVVHDSNACRDHCEVSGEEAGTFENCSYKPALFNNTGIHKRRFCESPAPSSCNIWYLNVYSAAPKGRDYYSVHKCTGSVKVSTIEVVISKEFQKPHTERITFENEQEDQRVEHDGTVLTFTPSSMMSGEKDFFKKCFLMDKYGQIAVVDKCNDDYTQITGEVGEIKCNNSDMSNYCSGCVFAHNLFGVDRDDATFLKLKSFCQLERLDYELMFEKSKLPREIGDIKVEQRPDRKVGKFQAVYSDREFALKMDAELQFTHYETLEKCTLEVKNHENVQGSIEYNGASFTVRAKANQKIKIVTKCDQHVRAPYVMTNKSTDFVNYTIHFNPDNERVNTICTISCGTDSKRMKLAGTFEYRKSTIINAGIQVSAISEVMTSLWDFVKEKCSDAMSKVSDALNSAKDFIKDQLNDPKIVVAGAIMVLFTVYAVIHCCFACVKSPLVLVFKALSCFCGLSNLSKTDIKKKKFVDEV